jgi:hypothetical protein
LNSRNDRNRDIAVAVTGGLFFGASKPTFNLSMFGTAIYRFLLANKSKKL